MTESPNILLIVLDALREDAFGDDVDRSDRGLRAKTCLASAPWTLPSCTSIVRGVAAHRHRHYWREPALSPNPLLDALPDRYHKVGLVNNGALSAGSGVETGFDRWTLTLDHDEPFERALRLIRRVKRRRPHFIMLHSNIAHDYYLPGADRYRPVDGPPALGDRVISWRDTTAEDRAGAHATYRSCAAAQGQKVRAVLDAVRQRDDFITAVTADHGEGFDYDLGRVHHGGRVHQDLLRVPLYIDLPSSTPAATRGDLADALESQVLGGIDVVPTLLDLAGVDRLPDTDGVPARTVQSRTMVGEDRRYFYLNDRFRLNFHGRNKNMSERDQALNQQLLGQLAEGPSVRSFVRYPDKLIVTDLRLAPGGATDSRTALLDLGGRLLGAPVLAIGGDSLLACEHYDLAEDPLEQHNLLLQSPDWPRHLTADWAGSVTMPTASGSEADLVGLLEGRELVGSEP